MGCLDYSLNINLSIIDMCQYVFW